LVGDAQRFKILISASSSHSPCPLSSSSCRYPFISMNRSYLSKSCFAAPETRPKPPPAFSVCPESANSAKALWNLNSRRRSSSHIPLFAERVLRESFKIDVSLRSQNPVLVLVQERRFLTCDHRLHHSKKASMWPGTYRYCSTGHITSPDHPLSFDGS